MRRHGVPVARKQWAQGPRALPRRDDVRGSRRQVVHAQGRLRREDVVCDHEPRARTRRGLHRHRRRLRSGWTVRAHRRRLDGRDPQPRPRGARHQVPLSDGRRTERHRRFALPHRPDGGRQPAAPQDRPHRPLPDPHARHRHPGGGDAARARRSRERRQGPLPGREQLRGVPSHRTANGSRRASTFIGSSLCRCNTA